MSGATRAAEEWHLGREPLHPEHAPSKQQRHVETLMKGSVRSLRTMDAADLSDERVSVADQPTPDRTSHLLPSVPDGVRMARILIADNDDELRGQLADALRDQGYEVETAAEGAEVVRMLDSAAVMPAVVVIDLLLPQVRGADVIRAMRGLAKARSVPVIVLSGASVHDDELAGLDVDAVFVKPVAARGLFAAIERACKGKR